jgi:ankyrin repeat protein
MGRTPLHKATYYSHPECVMWLVERGAQSNAEDENGETPVHYAAIRGLSSALIFMSAVGADLARPTKKGSTPIHLAARHDNIDTVMFLIEKDPQALAAVTQKGRSALHIAARNGKDQMTHVLLEHGADCNATDIFGNTPLHMACKYPILICLSSPLFPSLPLPSEKIQKKKKKKKKSSL